MRILIIDDDLTVRKYVARALIQDAEVIEAADQQTTKRLFSKDRFDTALVDVNLGSDDGLELAVWLRDMDPRLVVVVMSGDPTNENKALEAGLGPILKKPFTLEELKQRIL